jgi:dienelactone hydrolase
MNDQRSLLRNIIPFLVLALTGFARADDLRREVEALRPLDVSAQEKAVLDNLEQRARDALAAIHHAQDPREADEARGRLRESLEHSLGTRRLPKPAATNPRVVGTLKREGYHIEKIVYEALPNQKVPAHLYVPDGLKGRAPAILFYNGHWWVDSKTKPDFQAFCINMARLGFVVLTFDPFGQGERGVSSRDHRRTEGLLVGIAQQGFAEFETLCALEYLLSRPEVDPERIGMTGASGGGYNTWITAALDDRIKVAVPAVGTSDFLEQIRVCRPLDWYHASEHCHFVPGLIKYANNHEFVAMVAPKPLLIIACPGDQSFPLDGVREVAKYGKTLYASYGVPEKVGLFVDEKEGHGYQRPKREAAYGWFLRWLMNKGNGGPYPEPATETTAWDAEELRCFPKGHNEPAGPAMIEAVKRLAKNLPPSRPQPDLRRVLGPDPKAPSAHVDLSDVRLQRLVIPTETGVDVPAFLLRPEGNVKLVILAVDDRGKEALASDPAVPEMMDSGCALCGLDPRGIGESATEKMGWVFAVSLLLGENFVGRQAWDITRVAEALAASDVFRGKPILLWARGDNACLAATYALFGPAKDLWESSSFQDGFVSYRAFFDRPRAMTESFRLLSEDRDRTTAFDREIPAAYFAFRGLMHFDLPQILDLSAKPGHFSGLDGDRQPLTAESARVVLPENIKPWTGKAIRPQDVLRLFNGKDLSGLTTWLKDTKHEDPQHVFSVTEDGLLHISGDGNGYIATERLYRDYRLVVEYKWGKKTDGGEFVRNSGILLHATGPDGGAGGTWMSSIECQLAQGCVGDLIVIRGKDDKGETIPVSLTSDVILGPDNRPRWAKEGGKPREFTGGQLWWSKHDPDYKELLDTRGKDDVESPVGEWTRVECLCDGDRITVRVNGTEVNHCYKANPSAGKILIQSEGFELFVRKFELHPLDGK